MRPFLVVLFLLFAVTTTHAGIIDKAFEALEMKDYFKAKHLFHKVLDKERIAANYGLCRVHLEQQNPFYNLDSARVYALRTESLFKTAEKKAQEEKQQIKGQYDKWCNDHGVPIPPEYVAQSYQQTRNDGSVFLGWAVIGIILFVIFLLIVR
jgi:hypothetical protein